MKNQRKVSIACIYNSDNKILLQIRGAYSKNGEKYAFFGGGVEKGETAQEALIREAYEELGIKFNNSDYDFLGAFTQHFPENDFYAIRNLFMIYSDLRADEFDVFEGEGARYFTIEEARKLSFPNPVDNILDIIEEYLQKK